MSRYEDEDGIDGPWEKAMGGKVKKAKAIKPGQLVRMMTQGEAERAGLTVEGPAKLPYEVSHGIVRSVKDGLARVHWLSSGEGPTVIWTLVATNARIAGYETFCEARLLVSVEEVPHVGR